MKKLIILAGASGAGKSFLLQQISKINKDIVPIKKLSTRKKRPYETNLEIDLEFGCNETDIKNKCKYIYPYEDETYGIIKEDIDEAFHKGKMPFVIVRDCAEILEIKKDYAGKTITLYMQSGFSGNDLKKILRKQGRDEIDIKTRDRLTKSDYEQYRRFFREFDGVLINYYEAEPLITHFREILENEKIKDPTIYQDIFVLMSFNPNMNNTYKEMQVAVDLLNNELGLKLNIHRIDDQRGSTYPITDAILDKINKAEVIICDLTQEKQNVYFELGYAIAKKKPIIMFAKDNTIKAFDINGYRIVNYSDVTDLKDKLKEELKCFYHK